MAQCKEADLLLARDLIEERFAVDLNSMECRQRVASQKKKQALQFFDKHTSDRAHQLMNKN